MKSISVVFPIYNEKDSVNQTIEAFLDVLPLITDDFEIIAVNDASTDDTLSLLKNLAAKNNKIKVIQNKINKKLGGTLKKGFQIASKELILYSDFDMPFNPKDIKPALKIMTAKNADIVSAIRDKREVDGIVRCVYSYVYNLLIGTLFRVSFLDINSSLKLFKREILNTITLKSEGSFICAEFLIKCSLNNFKVIQFPYKYFPRTKGKSTLASISVIINILGEIIKLYPEIKAKQRNSPHPTKSSPNFIQIQRNY